MVVEEVARVKNNNDQLIKDLEQYQKLRVTDKDAAMVMAQEIASKNPGVIAALIQSSKDEVAYKTAQENSKALAQIKAASVKLGMSKAGGGSRSAISERFENNVLRSANEINRSLGLMEQIGINEGKGVLGGVVGHGTITSELAANFGRILTSEEQMNYNSAAGGMAMELAFVLNGGYKPSENQVEFDETKKKCEHSIDSNICLYPNTGWYCYLQNCPLSTK